ncbi:hypothetical protein CGZ69_18395 [Streptomyces peucetius subsp. caesius ATCC 27952]|nr:hypothetical protein CGZ69_18395 [Streptomyces peucetius subsp. caesius ATCC 27952]
MAVSAAAGVTVASSATGASFRGSAADGVVRALWGGTEARRGDGLSKAAETRSDARSEGVCVGTVAAEDVAGVRDDVSVAGSVRSVWAGTEAVAGSSRSARSRPNTLRSKLRIPMGEAFRMRCVR